MLVCRIFYQKLRIKKVGERQARGGYRTLPKKMYLLVLLYFYGL
jgi:hypothetical protein